MAEGKDAVAIHVRHGARAREADVTGGKGHRNHISRAERSGAGGGGSVRAGIVAAERRDIQAEGGELRLEGGGDIRRQAAEGKGRRHRSEWRGKITGAARALAFALDRDGREAFPARGQGADFEHVADGREARITHRLEALDLVGEDAGKFAIKIERAAAHTGHRAHALHARVGKLAQDHAFAGPEGVAENAGHRDRKGFGVVAFEDRPHFALHARLHFAERQQRGVHRLGGEMATHRGTESTE